ncbi:Mediator of RNA polymerase II transcription subunit 12 [Venturia nashicola]|uniref:Mediator of RNA polymerase II transcription subunit 12 n=1 Tax=Venturia nashicola TaxID=86259 RepID=A0A4Z1NSY2_9PEZI|nr:Mediator of RNA polymerase II transcription subunit 12 [Venturia nashicola]
MTSNPTLGIQAPPQQRAQPSSTHHSRTSSQASRANVGSARNPGLSVDSSGVQRGVGTSDNGSGRPSPATSNIDSPSRSANGARGGRYPNTTEAYHPNGTASERPPVAQIGFPPRPGWNAPQREQPPSSAVIGPIVTSKSTVTSASSEPPAPSLLYPGGKPADYHPWTDNHIEDNLTEQTVKSGFLNKPPVTNETNTARPGLWQYFKNKPGLNTLSSLFVTVLEKRQALGRLTGPSTFKPPPRVVLTTTKRDAWLSELANPAFPLRRLNRTIPYGINGKILLEQCLGKEIPTARAVWLTKCIGSNELRGLKRKVVTGAPGISGELKWIREWTMHVEQFVDATINNCGGESWKEKMQYVLRLVFHLFSEQLLDQEHYLDWVLSAFESSNTERMPMWLVHIQLYWNFLVTNRKRGRRLAEGLCAQLEAGLATEDSDLLLPARQRMELLVANLVVSHRGCLILPRTWNRYERVLQSIAKRSTNSAVQEALRTIAKRNNRLSKPSWEQESKSPSSSCRQAFATLDAVGLEFSVNHTASSLSDLFDSAQEVVPIVLQWSSTIYRHGPHRTYIAARVLRRLKAIGVDLEMGVLEFLTSLPKTSAVEESKIVRVVAELIRSRHFAVGRLLQSMIARDLVSVNDQESPHAQRLIHLVLGIPTHDLPQHVVDLRQIILDDSGLGIGQTNHEDNIELVQDAVSEAMSAPPTLHFELKGNLARLDSMDLSGKLAISLWLRQDILNRMNATKDAMSYSPSSQSSFVWAFYVARNLLEHFEDFSILADVVGICLPHDHVEVLTSVTDTIYHNGHCFAAIGALKPLSTQVVERYQSLRTEMPLERSYLQSIVDLCVFVGDQSNTIQQLNHDIARCDQRNAMAICSPASDNAVDMLSTTPMESDEEIERILSSGTTMDEQSMSRVFKRLTTRLLERPTDCGGHCGRWFSRLRSFDETNFDGLMRRWVASIIGGVPVESYRQIFPSLVGSSCLSLQTIIQIADERVQSTNLDNSIATSLEVAVLYALLPFDDGKLPATIPEVYKYRLQQRRVGHQSRDIILKHVSRAIALSGAENTGDVFKALQRMLLAPETTSFLRDAAVHAGQALFRELDLSSKSTLPTTGTLRTLLVSLLDPKGSLGLSALEPRQELAQLVQVVDDLSLPFCQIEAQYLLRAGSASNREATEKLALVLFDAILPAQDGDRPVWLELIEFLDKTVLFKLRTLAEGRILKLVSEQLSGSKTEEDSNQTKHTPTEPSTENINTVGETLGLMRDILAANQLPMSRRETDSTLQFEAASHGACPYFTALLHLLAVHKKAGVAAKTGTSDSAPVLPVLFALLHSPWLEAYPMTAELVCDISAQFADDLPDEMRVHLLRSESLKYKYDARIAFLLGPVQQTEGWLGLVTTNTAPSLAQPGTPTTSSARFGAGQPQLNARAQLPARPQPPSQRPGGQAGQQKSFNPPVPFPLRRWELLPDQGSTTGGNDTSISLSLFGARKV